MDSNGGKGSGNNTMETRRTRRLRTNPSLEHSASSSSSRRVSQTPGDLALNVLSVVLGNRLVRTWYPSQYREELVSGEPVDRLYICERCFKYTKEVVLRVAHQNFCEYRLEIPGRIVYDEEKYSVYEVDGEEHELFAQNLSLFAKLFIENKSVCFDVHTFLYYLLVQKPTATPTKSPSKSRSQLKRATPASSPSKPAKTSTSRETVNNPLESEQIVGFFSKEKLSWDDNNLACILVFPPWQRLGLGQLLIKLSYALGKIEGRMGGPERPLSSPGARSYNQYWSRTLAQTILAIPSFSKSKSPKKVSVKDLSDETWIAVDDVIGTLQGMDVLGDARSRDGAVKIDKVLLRAWCKERGIELERETLSGIFHHYSDEDEDELEEDDE